MSHQETIDLIMKARRREAHGRFRRWAESRERISGVKSTMGQIREMQDHAGSRSVPDRSGLNNVERACDAIQTALRVERYVRGMPKEWQMVVAGYYLHNKKQEELAKELGVERNRIVSRLQDAQERLAHEWQVDAMASIPVFGERLTSACKPVDSRHAA